MTEEIFLTRIKEHEGIINKLLYLYVDVAEDKKDLYQEIVLQAWRSIHRFKGDSKFSTWLYRVSLNTVITFNRKEKRLPQSSMNEAPDVPSHVSEQSERSMQLASAIRALNDIDKSIITLHLDDYSNDEISEMIGITKNNVAVKLHRIKEDLKKKLKGNG